MEKDYFCEEEFHLAPIPLWLSVAIQIALLLLTYIPGISMLIPNLIY